MGPRPALVYFALLALGVALSRLGAPPGGPWLPALVTAALLGATALVRRNLAPPALVLLGWWMGAASLAPPEGARAIREEEVGRAVRIEGVLLQDAVVRDGRARLRLRVEAIDAGAGRRPADEPVAAYLAGATPPWSEGTRVEVSGKLDRPHAFRNPGAWDFEASLRREGVRFTLMGAARGARELGAPPGEALGPLRGAVVAARERIHRFLAAAAPGETGGVLRALVLGDRLAFSDALYEKFQKTGVAHVLAISGMNLAIVGWIAYRTLKAILKLWPPILLRVDVRKWCTAAALGPILFYAAITGPVVSAGRAAVMSAVFVAAALLERENDPLSALGVAGLALVAARPQSLFSPSFQLSCAAVLAMIVFAPAILRVGAPEDAEGLGRARRLGLGAWRWVREMLLVSLVTELGTAPIVAAHFSRLTWIGPLANLVVIPLTGFLAAPIGLLAAALSIVSEPLARAVLLPAVLSVDATIAWIEWIARVPGLSRPVPAPGPAGIVGAYLLLAAAAPPARGRRLPLAGAGAAALAAAFLLGRAPAAERSRPSATFLEFDRGEAAWIETAGGEGILVYGGVRARSRFDAGRRVLFPFLASTGVRGIDHLILPPLRGRRALGADFLQDQLGISRCWRGPDIEPPPELGACGVLGEEDSPLRRPEGGDGLLWAEGEARIWFAGPLRKDRPRVPPDLAGAGLLAQAEWEPGSRNFPPGGPGAAALVVTGKSPEDACGRARAADWVAGGGACRRVWEDGALAARWDGGAWRIARAR